MTRSSRLLAAGVIVIVLGLVVAFFALRDDSDPIAVNDPSSTATTGATGGDATDGDGEPGEFASERGIGEVREDAQRMPIPLEIPEGQEAVAISAAYSNAVAAIPAPGDRVNIYAIFSDGLPEQLEDPTATVDPGQPVDSQAKNGVVRLFSHVEVLGVSGVQAAAGGGGVTLVLAVDPDDAERLIYQVATQQVWFTLVNADDPEVAGKGVTHGNVLARAS